MGRATRVGDDCHFLLYAGIFFSSGPCRGGYFPAKKIMRSGLPAVILVCFFLLLAAAAPVDAFFQAQSTKTPREGAIFRLLGETRSVFSNMAILTADKYYHGGVGHSDHDHQGTLGLLLDEDDCHDHHHHEHPEINKFNILLYVGSEIEITDHIHLSGDTLAEIMPWLDYAVRIDPFNELAYVLGAFYLSERFDRTEEAIDLLRRGLSIMPESKELNAELGRIYLMRSENASTAIRYFKAARRAMSEEASPIEKRQLFSLLAFAYEEAGEFEEALSVYEELMEIFPDAEPLKARAERAKGLL